MRIALCSVCACACAALCGTRLLCRCFIALRGKRVTADCPLHRACRRRGFRALRERRIERIRRRSIAARRHDGRARACGRTTTRSQEVRRIAAALLHLREHGEIRLCHGTQSLILRLGILQRTFECLAPHLDPLDLIIEIRIVFLQIPLVPGGELLPLPQFLTDLCLAVRIGRSAQLLRLVRLHLARLHGRAHRLRKTRPRLDAVLHLTTQITQLRIVPNASDSLEYCHNITSV